jgi:hypothetical protein
VGSFGQFAVVDEPTGVFQDIRETRPPQGGRGT